MRASSVSGCRRGIGRRFWMRHRASVRAAGSGCEQMLDRARVVAKDVPLADAEASALRDDDAARLEGLGGFFNGLAPGEHCEVRTYGTQRFDDRIGPRL